MPENGHINLLVATGLISAAAIFQRLRKWRSANTSSSLLETYRRPEGAVSWLTDEEFACLVASCDAFVPALDEDEVRAQIFALCLPGEVLERIYADSEKNMSVLQAGALNRSVHIKVAELLDASTSDVEKAELKQLLTLLATSVGCFVATGLAAPFYGLSLENRIFGIKRLKYSFLADLRIAYQVYGPISYFTL